MPLQSGRMPLPVFKYGTIAKGALAAGQAIRLGGFLMTACSATASTMTSRVIKSDLRINSEFAKQLDPMELSSVNELLDRIAALGVATEYNQIGLKTDLREINSPQVTHRIAVAEKQCGDASSISRTSYVHIPDPSMPDSRGGERLRSSTEPEVRHRTGLVGQRPAIQASKFGNFMAFKPQDG